MFEEVKEKIFLSFAPLFLSSFSPFRLVFWLEMSFCVNNEKTNKRKKEKKERERSGGRYEGGREMLPF